MKAEELKNRIMERFNDMSDWGDVIANAMTLLESSPIEFLMDLKDKMATQEYRLLLLYVKTHYPRFEYTLKKIHSENEIAVRKLNNEMEQITDILSEPIE